MTTTWCFTHNRQTLFERSCSGYGYDRLDGQPCGGTFHYKANVQSTIGVIDEAWVCDRCHVWCDGFGVHVVA